MEGGRGWWLTNGVILQVDFTTDQDSASELSV